MSVRFDAAGDHLNSSGTLPGASDLTVMFWVYLTTDRNDYQVFWIVDPDYSTNGRYVSTSTDGVTMEVYEFGGATGANGSVLNVGQWYHIAYVEDDSANTIDVYLDGVLDMSLSSVPNRATDVMWFGSDGVDFINGREENIKIWQAALTQAEVQLEMLYRWPQRFANLYEWHPTYPGATERLSDWSGNGRNFTAAGTLTDEDGPPLIEDMPVWLPTPSAGAGGQTISLSFLADGSALYAPQLNQNVALSFLADVSALYAPLLQQTVTLDFLADESELYAFQVNEQVALPFLADTSDLYAFTVTPGAAIVNLDFLADSSALYAFQANQSVGLDFLADTSALYVFEVQPGAATVALDFLADSSQLYDFAVNQAVALAFLADSSALYAFQLDQQIALPLLADTSALYDLTVEGAGSQTVSLAFLADGSDLYDLAVQPGAATVSLPLLADSSQFYSFALGLTLPLAFLPESSALYAMALTPGAATVALAFLADGSALYSLILSGDLTGTGIPPSLAPVPVDAYVPPLEIVAFVEPVFIQGQLAAVPLDAYMPPVEISAYMEPVVMELYDGTP